MSNILTFPVKEQPKERTPLETIVEQELLDLNADQYMIDVVLERMEKFLVLASFERGNLSILFPKKIMGSSFRGGSLRFLIRFTMLIAFSNEFCLSVASNKIIKACGSVSS